MEQATRTRVAIIFGGVSSEHDVSCLTAGGVVRAIDTAALRRRRHRDHSHPGAGCRSTPPTSSRSTSPRMGCRGSMRHRPEAVLVRREGGGRVATVAGDRLVEVRDFDVAFALLHGPFGEDGTIQGLFEMMGIRYVGAGVAASAIGMDKDLMKSELRSAGLPVCPWVTIAAVGWRGDRAAILRRIEADLSFPVYVKPARGGSSVGITRAATPRGGARAPSRRRCAGTPR
jgi:D-alanine-D-alanine ligase